MSVTIFVHLDEQGRELPADQSHESWGTIGLIQLIHAAFHQEQMKVAILVSLRKPSADLVIITERGIGVVELKDVPGTVTLVGDGRWLASYRSAMKVIQSGSAQRERAHPHEQVREYAITLRQQLKPYLAKEFPGQVDHLHWNTAVCFTHPAADIAGFSQNYASPYQNPKDSWERFRIITPAEIVKWVHALSFDSSEQISSPAGHGRYKRLSLSPTAVHELPQKQFGMREANEINQVILRGEPVVHLFLLEDDHPTQTFALIPGANTIGRDYDAAVCIPLRYASVSRHHARITYALNGISIQDLNSQHGTFVNGQLVNPEHSQPLQNGDLITLCVAEGTDKHACTLQFRTPPFSSGPPSTRGMITY